ncbi:hypothetical protein FocnCong_v021462 [Fusarium oxysporum f. sp. conglutinans]|nr:hypothetical protein FocnCong_v021462 [Fusarium oxysporum f. sp. conglutinans]
MLLRLDSRPISKILIVATIASAGKCKPHSFSQTTTETASVESTTAGLSTTLAASTTTSADVTVETSLTETSAETSAVTIPDTTSALTTFVTSFSTSSAETTTVESVTTTTAAAPPAAVTCPSASQQCVGTIAIQCDTILVGLSQGVTVDDAESCANLCNSDDTCAGFTYNDSIKSCFLSDSQVPDGSFSGWISGFKGTCQGSP